MENTVNHLAQYVLISALFGHTALAASTPVFINEIHYDNIGADVGEKVEIAAPAGTNLTDWQIVFYNGNNQSVYKTKILSAVIADAGNGFGVLSIAHAGIQNGAPDGLALVNKQNQVIQFLSYEGIITAEDGPALGMTSTDIAVTESNTATELGHSLQLIGNGSVYEDFTWNAATSATFGQINIGQIFSAPVKASAYFNQDDTAQVLIQAISIEQ